MATPLRMFFWNIRYTMRVLRDAGLRVPEVISVVAFDDLHPALNFDPFFTVAAQPAYEMGERATGDR